MNKFNLGLGDRTIVTHPPMVLILDGNSEHVAHARRKNRSFLRKNSIWD